MTQTSIAFIASSANLRLGRLRSLTFMVVEDLRFSVSVVSFTSNFLVELLKTCFCESLICEELLDLILYELSKPLGGSVLDFELVDKETFKLFSFLDLYQAFSSCLTHFGDLRPDLTECLVGLGS